jgi:hypothetical protein
VKYAGRVLAFANSSMMAAHTALETRPADLFRRRE